MTLQAYRSFQRTRYTLQFLYPVHIVPGFFFLYLLWLSRLLTKAFPLTCNLKAKIPLTAGLFLSFLGFPVAGDTQVGGTEQLCHYQLGYCSTEECIAGYRVIRANLVHSPSFSKPSINQEAALHSYHIQVWYWDLTSECPAGVRFICYYLVSGCWKWSCHNWENKK